MKRCIELFSEFILEGIGDPPVKKPIGSVLTLEPRDMGELKRLLNEHPEKESILHAEGLKHMHIHFDIDGHIVVQFSHLGKDHDITFKLEGTYPADLHQYHLEEDHPNHSYHDPTHIDAGFSVHIPLKKIFN